MIARVIGLYNVFVGNRLNTFGLPEKSYHVIIFLHMSGAETTQPGIVTEETIVDLINRLDTMTQSERDAVDDGRPITEVEMQKWRETNSIYASHLDFDVITTTNVSGDRRIDEFMRESLLPSCSVHVCLQNFSLKWASCYGRECSTAGRTRERINRTNRTAESRSQAHCQ